MFSARFTVLNFEFLKIYIFQQVSIPNGITDISFLECFYSCTLFNFEFIRICTLRAVSTLTKYNHITFQILRRNNSKKNRNLECFLDFSYMFHFQITADEEHPWLLKDWTALNRQPLLLLFVQKKYIYKLLSQSGASLFK